MNKLDLIRKSKSLFMKWNLHHIAGSLEGGLLNLAYMSKLSKWRNDNAVTGYNDWYQQSWDYSRRINLYKSVLEKQGLAQVPIDYIEFGVSSGSSFRWWLQHQQHEASNFFGFDTFEGLPEAFGPFGKGEMAASLESIGVTDPRATFYKGLFQDTLIPFLDQYKSENRKLIHMDADLFSATIFALSQLYRFLNDGDIIMFDEFAVPTHEFRAFQIFADSFYINYEVIAAANNYLFLAVKIRKD
ncbi:TylF/MycF/NovP-related O-methyltransferase [Niabella ginsengisoli]|uniref:TylF/MycF family methyltransferase n=1 Tax=Niabella ginsengisoli TaxID=522298 RepID=A0ABS9SM73_9BACT|nr:TylF/MycF/NovP-related O-methyltransferase [Niabella ginsengisoli]MCH5599462.1 TylF/MycF family methyltransferase [Niabella ginsengisoli]